MDGMTMTDDKTTNTAGESTGCRCMHCAGQDLHHDLRLSREDTQRVRTALAPLYPDEPPTVRVGWLAGNARSEIDRLRAELGTAREMRPPTGMWQVSVRVPMDLPREMRDSLSEALAAAVHDWEPQDRDGWDVEVSGHPTYQPCPDARAHTGGLPDDCGHPEHISARQIRDCLAQPAEENTARVRVLIDQYAAEDPGDGEFEAGFRRGDVAPEAFDALRAATGHNSEIDQRIGAALLKAQRPAGESGPRLEVDDEAGPWYIRLLDEPVARTTEQHTVHVDWTRDGRMIGVEILAGESGCDGGPGCSAATHLPDCNESDPAPPSELPTSPRLGDEAVRYEQERERLAEAIHKKVNSSVQRRTVPFLVGDAERAVSAVIEQGWTPPFEAADTLTPAPKDPQSGDNSCGEGCRPGLHGPLCSETESFRPEEEHDCAVCEISAELAEERIAHQATSEELTRLKADMRIRQGALADVLGVPRHDDPTSYYANIEAVAALRRELDRTRPAPAEERGETRHVWRKGDRVTYLRLAVVGTVENRCCPYVHRVLVTWPFGEQRWERAEDLRPAPSPQNSEDQEDNRG